MSDGSRWGWGAAGRGNAARELFLAGFEMRSACMGNMLFGSMSLPGPWASESPSASRRASMLSAERFLPRDSGMDYMCLMKVYIISGLSLISWASAPSAYRCASQDEKCAVRFELDDPSKRPRNHCTSLQTQNFSMCTPSLLVGRVRVVAKARPT